jgi:pilus assembly protein CpaB
MNQRFLSVLIFAFVIAAGASFLFYRAMAGRRPSKAAPSIVKVVLAAHNLEVGTMLREQDLKTGDWPGALPLGALSKAEDVMGRGVTSPIYDGEPILESRLAAKGAGGGLAATIPKGMRAFGVRVNDVVGVAGFVTPGMRVDVLISGNSPSSPGVGSQVTTLLQNVQVLSAGQDFKKDGEGKPILVQVVNLLVTPEQAEKLSLAANQTTIQLVLRNPVDTEVAKTPGVAMANLFQGTNVRPAQAERPAVRRVAAPPPALVPVVQAAPKEPFVMEIIQGGKKTETKFKETGEDRP